MVKITVEGPEGDGNISVKEEDGDLIVVIKDSADYYLVGILKLRIKSEVARRIREHFYFEKTGYVDEEEEAEREGGGD